ncbi:MAG: DUF167 domain-containing protein [Planctomycetes bacterium]|nr:DUF167 domain-containing protein [Planctomycetota bacterium]
MSHLRIEQAGADVLIWIKAVPGASRDEIAGVVGDRLKVRTTAPPEAGKANKAICKLIADALRVKSNDVTIAHGQARQGKVLRVRAHRAAHVRVRLTVAGSPRVNQPRPPRRNPRDGSRPS